MSKVLCPHILKSNATCFSLALIYFCQYLLFISRDEDQLEDDEDEYQPSKEELLEEFSDEEDYAGIP